MTQARLQEPTDERLIQVALDLLSAAGPETLSLRRIARAAGVSHGAPLRHFRSLAHLRSQLAARGFALLSHAMEDAGAELPVGAGALPRLVAAGRAYVAIATANPGLFSLMFRPDELDTTDPVFVHESSQAFQALLRHVRAAQDAGWQSQRDTQGLAASIWASVHGLATLWAQGAIAGAVPGTSLDDVLQTTLELLFDEQQGDHR